MFGQLQVCAGRESIRLTPRQERRLFRTPPEFIASGSRACAYATNGEVVKVTWHEPDAAAALALSKNPVPGTLRVLGVDRLGDFYYAIRSKRVPAPGPIASVVQRCASQGRLDGAFVERARTRRRAPASVPSAVKECLQQSGPRVGVSPAKALAFTKELSAAQARLADKLGIHWFDVHAEGNFSQDDKGRPVIIDLGQSLVPSRWLGALKHRSSLRGTCIPEGQRRVHVITEALSVALVVPFATFLALMRKDLPTWARVGLGTVAAASLVIDGWLLTRWRRRRTTC